MYLGVSEVNRHKGLPVRITRVFDSGTGSQSSRYDTAQTLNTARELKAGTLALDWPLGPVQFLPNKTLSLQFRRLPHSQGVIWEARCTYLCMPSLVNRGRYGAVLPALSSISLSVTLPYRSTFALPTQCPLQCPPASYPAVVRCCRRLAFQLGNCKSADFVCLKGKPAFGHLWMTVGHCQRKGRAQKPHETPPSNALAGLGRLALA